MNDFDAILRRVNRPGRYLGREVNSVHKQPDEMAGRIVLAYPDLYELGMSYLGLQVLYGLVNDQPDLWAERVFAPDLDFERLLRQAGTPLASLESKTPLAAFDVVGFSLQHELNYPDLLVMLELGGIPIRAADRSVDHPLVIAGGPCAANPEPLAPALDAVYLGDAEPGLPDLIRTVGLARKRNQTREAILDTLAEMPGIYVPSRYRVRTDRQGKILAVEAQVGAPARVVRAVAPDLSSLVPPVRPIVPAIQAVHDRLAVEVQRGCTRGCRFCQAGMINRPVRQRGIGPVLSAVNAGLESTGHEQVVFLSLSAGDHPQIHQILKGFYRGHAGACISASLPSLRAETLTPELAELVKTVRKSGFTIAPEVGTDRLRRVINKDLRKADVLAAALGAFRAGWRLLKLYFMVGLPTETEQDREAIVDLVKEVRATLVKEGFKPRINVGLSTFVPKAQTPFQWEAMIDRASSDHVNRTLREGLGRLRGVKTTWTRPELSWAEGLLARGDRRQFEALASIAASGQRLAGWNEHFQPELFADAFERLDLEGGPDFYLRQRDQDECLPWDHLDLGPSRDFLEAERQLALGEQPTADCASDACSDCGACLENQTPRLADEAPPQSAAPPEGATATTETTSERIRLRLKKGGAAALHSHLEFMVSVFRALRRARWPLVHTAGFHPKPKVSFGPACPLGAESLAEFLDVHLEHTTDLDALLDRLNRELGEGLEVLEGRVLAASEPGIMRRLEKVRYRIRLAPGTDRTKAEESCQELLARTVWQVKRRVKGKIKSVDLRPNLAGLSIENGSGELSAILEVTAGEGATARPSEIAQEAFGLDHASIVRERLIFHEPPDDAHASPGATEERKP